MSTLYPYLITKQHAIDLKALGQMVVSPAQPVGWKVIFYMNNVCPDPEVLCATPEEAEELLVRVFTAWRELHNAIEELNDVH